MSEDNKQALATDEMSCMGELFFRAVETFDDSIAMRYRLPDRWVDITWKEFGEQVRQLAAGLIGLGVEKGDRVSILSNSRTEWAVIDQATMAIGAVTVPIYQSNLPHEVQYILNHAGSKVVFVEDSEQLGKVLEVRTEVPELQHAVLITGKVKTEGFRVAYDKLQDRGKEAIEQKDAALWPDGKKTGDDPFKAWQGAVSRDDLATMVFTSGTTGPPKGAMLNHESLLFEMEALAPTMGVTERDETLLFLPMAHIFARVGYLGSLRMGYAVSYAESIERLMDNIAEVRPTFVFSVPRIYEKVYNKVLSGVQSGSRLKKQLFAFAMLFGSAASRWLRRPAKECRKANLVSGVVAFVLCLVLASLWLRPAADLGYHLGVPTLKPLTGQQLTSAAHADEHVQVTGKLVAASLQRRLRGDKKVGFIFTLEGYPDLAVHVNRGEQLMTMAEADDMADGDPGELGEVAEKALTLKGRLYRGMGAVGARDQYKGWKKKDGEEESAAQEPAPAAAPEQKPAAQKDDGEDIDSYLGTGGDEKEEKKEEKKEEPAKKDDSGDDIDAYLGTDSKKDEAKKEEDKDEGAGGDEADIDAYLGTDSKKAKAAPKPTPAPKAAPKAVAKKAPAAAKKPEPKWLLVVDETPAAGNLWSTNFPLFMLLLFFGVIALVKIVKSKKGVPWYLDFGFQAAQMLVFNKLKNLFGGKLRFFLSGGAPLSKEIAEFFHASGILVLEGYGLTENTAACNLNTHDAFKLGTVGRPLPGVEVRIADDGEIMLRGPNVFAGYYKREEATAEALEEDGWFHTGDIGVFDDDGFLRITDRKKDLIVTSGGKNIAPQNLENLMKTDPLISQIMVYGDKRNFLTALITLDPDEAAAYAEHKEIEYDDLAELADNPIINEKMERVLAAKNKDLASYETVKKFAILPEDFEVGEELTPTLKVKRKFAIEKYWDILDALYVDTRGKKS